MTANELADLNEWSCCAHSKQVSAMLRQQAQEIEELRIQIANEEESYMLLNEYCLCAKESNKQLTEKIGQLKKELALQKLSDIGQEIENRESAIHATSYWKGIAKVKPRELTDEEIGGFIHQMVLCCQVHPNSADINVLGLAQIVEDILKKASEK